MSWIKTDDNTDNHTKVRLLDERYGACIWAYGKAVLDSMRQHCARGLTDGRVTVREALRLTPIPARTVRRVMLALLDVGLLDAEAVPAKGELPEVVWVHNYLDYNPSRADVKAKRARWAGEKKAARAQVCKDGVHSEATFVPTSGACDDTTLQTGIVKNQAHSENVHDGFRDGVAMPRSRSPNTERREEGGPPADSTGAAVLALVRPPAGPSVPQSERERLQRHGQARGWAYYDLERPRVFSALTRHGPLPEAILQRMDAVLAEHAERGDAIDRPWQYLAAVLPRWLREAQEVAQDARAAAGAGVLMPPGRGGAQRPSGTVENATSRSYREAIEWSNSRAGIIAADLRRERDEREARMRHQQTAEEA